METLDIEKLPGSHPLEPEYLAARYGKSQASLAQMRYVGNGPAFVKIGKKVRYLVRDVLAWERAHTMTRTGN